MATIDAFLPMDRRAALAQGFELADRVKGAALFADISGFTPLSLALSGELGVRRGAEELNNQINRIFSAIISQVHAFHGSVIGFSGDAITCWFDGDDGRKACTSALAMLHALEALGPAYTPEGSEISIGLKVSVAAGRARRFLVGDPNIRQIEVLAGSILDRTANAERLANPGQIIISQEVYQNLGDDLTIVEDYEDADGLAYFRISALQHVAKNDPWPILQPLPAGLPDRWILPAILQRFEMGKGQFLADLRVATAVFMKFSGIEYDADDLASHKLNDFVCWVQAVLEHYGGILEHVTLGDKGSYLFIIFGAPIAHEDDLQRALSAALDLRRPPDHLAYLSGIQIGVNHGRVHAGTYGSQKRLTYGIQGETTNIAAGLMGGAASGMILISAKLAAAAGRDFRFLPHEAITIKGLAAPMPVVYLQDRQQRLDDDGQGHLAQYQVIGRLAEREQLDTVIRHAAEGQNQILIIEGEAGIGKSNLAASLKFEANSLGIGIYEGAGSAVEQSSPYFAWRPIFRSLFGMLQQDGDVPGVESPLKIISAVSPDLLPLAPLLNPVLSLDLPQNDRTGEMNGQDRANNLQQLLCRVLNHRAQQGPLLIVLEDAHWLDASSWELARAVVREVSSLLLVIVSRPPIGAEAAYQQFKQHPLSKTILLQQLDEEAVLNIVRQRLGVQKLPQPVADLIVHKAEGHPFFSEELAYALRDAGHIQIENGQVRMITSSQDLQRLSFPDTIQGVITSRVDGVSARQQLILKVASVIGRIFSYRILHDINPIESGDEELRTDIAALEKLEITPLETPEPELSYIFRHIITQEVVYELLTFTQRKRLHQVTAEWYEQKQERDLPVVYPLLAHHWTIAEVTEKAITYSLKAGLQAQDNGSFREAIKHLSHGLALNEKAQVISDPEQLAEWNYLLGTAYRQTGQLEASQRFLSAALDYLERPFPKGNVRLTASLMGQFSRQILHRLAPGYFDGRSKDPQRTLLLAKIYEGLQHVNYYQDQTTASVYCIFGHLNLGEEAPPTAQRARSYSAMVNVAGVTGLHKQALGYVRLTEKALAHDMTPSDRGLVQQYLAIYYAGAGMWAENEANCQEAIAIADSIGNRRRHLENLSCLALALYSQGDLQRSLSMRRQVLAMAERDDDRQIQTWGFLELAEINLLLQRPEQAVADLEKAAAVEEGRGMTEAIWLYGLQAVAHHRLGDRQGARSALNQAHQVTARSTPGAFYLLEALSGMAEVNFAFCQADPKDQSVKKGLERTLDMLKQFARSFPFSAPRYLLWNGEYINFANNSDKAIEIWQEGEQRARQLKMPYDQALLMKRLAEQTGDAQGAVAAQEIMKGLIKAVSIEDSL